MENKAPKMKSTKSHSSSKMHKMSSSTRKQVKSRSTSALPKNIPRSKKDDYKTISKSSLLQDFKNSAVNGFANVKQKFNSFSSLLKHSKKSRSDLENYCPMSEQPTPIKLYSPFTIESPLPAKVNLEEKLKLRQQLFVSPTNKIKEDVAGLEMGINELHILSRRIQQNSSQSQEQSNINLMEPSTSASTRLMFDDFSLI